MCSTPRGCALRAMRSKPKASAARAPRWQRADRILFVIDAVADPQASGLSRGARRGCRPVCRVTLVFNKIDLVTNGALPVIAAAAGGWSGVTLLRLSALTGEGFGLLAAHLKASVGFEPEGAGALSARARHLEALARVDASITDAARLLERAPGAGTGGRGVAPRPARARGDSRRRELGRAARAHLRALLHREMTGASDGALDLNRNNEANSSQLVTDY